MGLYDRYLLPRLLHVSMKNPEVRKQRARIVPAAAGRVLEIGIGSGLNLQHYGSNVTSVDGIDPSPALLGMAGDAAVQASFFEAVKRVAHVVFSLPRMLKSARQVAPC